MTTTSDVAAFVREHMADHARRRQEALEYALSAAAERSHVAKVLESASASSSSGIEDAQKKIAAVQVTSPAVPSARASDAKDVGALGTPAPLPAETSNATLGSAAVASPVPPSWEPPRKRGKLAFVAGVAALGGLAATAIMLHGSGGRPTERVSAATGLDSAEPPPASAAPWTELPATRPTTDLAMAAPGADGGPEPTPPKITPNGAGLVLGHPQTPGQTTGAAAAPVPAPVAPPPRPAKRRRVDDGF
jgi:hypothetical protein